MIPQEELTPEALAELDEVTEEIEQAEEDAHDEWAFFHSVYR